MAHSALHFSAGVIAGSVAAAPMVVRALRRGRRVALSLAAWLAISWGLGGWAVIPGVLRRLGVPDRVCDGAWANVFLLYPFINGLKPGGETMGPLVMAACFGAQYATLLAAIVWLRRRRSP